MTKTGICLKNIANVSFWKHVLNRFSSAILDWQSDSQVGIVTASLQTIIPSVSGSPLICNLPVIAHTMGDTPYRDLVPLCSIVKWKSPKKIFEFGTFSGLTSLSMLVNCENDARLWTLDLDPNSRRAAKDLSPWDRSVDDTRVGGFFRDTPYSERIEQLFGDSLEFDTTPFRKAMDLIFIDASHELKYVESDTEKALEMLAPGGIVVWHDYPNADGVRACLNENAKKYPIVQLEGTIIAVYCSSSASE